MRKSTKKVLIGLGVLGAAAVLVPSALWLSLKHEPQFYRTLVETPIEHVEKVAEQFEQGSLQLRNDIVNEPTWEGIFTDREVNAWLAEGLMKHFADEIPRDMHDPRILFENDRVTLAFKLDQQGVSTVVSVVLRVAVPEENVLELVLEKVRAGALPIPPDKFIEPFKKRAASHGLDMTWADEGGHHVARIAYHTHADRKDVILERVQVVRGQLRLSGRSTRGAGQVSVPKLPDSRTLQLQLPKRKTQSIAPEPTSPAEMVRSEAAPVR